MISSMRKKSNDIIKFGFFTDSHLSVIRNEFRTDNFFESVMSKLQQSYKFFEKSKCEFVVCGGDIFDKYCSHSHPMILRARDVFKSSNLITYYIIGQHDILGYERSTVKGSNLAFLSKICDGKLVEIVDHLSVCGVNLYASHVDQKPEEVLSSVQKSKDPNIVISHSLLSDKAVIGQIDVRNFSQTNADLVLSGDLHCGFGPFESKGTLFYNPGSLARTSKEHRRPKVCAITLSKIMETWSVDIEDFYLECEEYPFPEEEKKVEVSKDQDSGTYIEAFKKFKSESKDIFERLDKVGNAHGIDRNILIYIQSKKKS